MSYPRKFFVLYLLKLLVFLTKNINSDYLVFVTFLRLYVWKFATWKKKTFLEFKVQCLCWALLQNSTYNNEQI